MESIQMPQWRRAVIKVGSGLIAPDGKDCSSKYTITDCRIYYRMPQYGKGNYSRVFRRCCFGDYQRNLNAKTKSKDNH